MRLYTSLSKMKYLDKNYSLKYLFIAFLGIHIPLIGITVLALMSGFKTFSPPTVIECTLILTLIACGITLWMQSALAKPIVLTKNALAEYLSKKTLPTLPTDFKDEVGLLMNNTNTALYQLDELLKEKRDFIYLLSHDLKTPLHNVLTLAHLMQDDEYNESKDEYLHLIRQSTRKQLQLITNVLNLATTEYTDFTSLRPVYLEQLVNRVVKDLNISIYNKQLQVLVDVPWDMNLIISEELFSLALTNLLTNAIKFSKRNGEILIRAAVMQNQAVIRVVDYGIGFPSGKAPSFQPFTKATRPGTDGESSTGLGLYFTKKIIGYHGGTLTAESNGEEKGARFIISLPK